MSAINDYSKDIEAKFKSNKATEHTYRRDLEVLLETIGGNNVQVINEPKRNGSNAPDYYISRDVLTIGFVEAKDIDKNLSLVENSEQLHRYRQAYNNLLLTNYLDFRWYVEGEFFEQVTIGTLDKGKIRFDSDKFDALAGMLRRYYATEVPEIISPEDLARRMAKMTRELAQLIVEALDNTDNPPKDLISKKEAVARVLLPNLDNRQFSDMYAQTIAYGLFAARARYTGKPEKFTLETAFFQLPKTNPFLGKLFQNIAAELDTRVKFMADVIAQLLAYAKGLDDVIANFGHSTRQADPVIHFYETFLNAYDATQRERRGVYYTPEPVVSYIVRSVDHILRETFGRNEGLADKETLILDPATGTGTFLYKVIQEIHDSMAGNRGMWQSYVQKNLLKRLFGFELLMAPYTVAHMKLNLLLGELGYNFESDDRLGIYLTNTLEENVQQATLPFAEYLTDEANAATEIKKKKEIMVVLGNPPYSGHSANRSRDEQGKFTWIGRLLDDYYKVDGEPLGERNSK
ncbi:MAG: N-6 DNA methylase, partial [Anaerolineae bacterium]|nr:N-6 DNA methylase [Anaerolineae bacterium]